MNRVKKFFWGKGAEIGYAAITALFTIVPEDFFRRGFIDCFWSDTAIISTNRIIYSLIAIALGNLAYYLYQKFRTSVTIADRNFTIIVEYGDIFNVVGGKKIISFDECYSINVGEKPENIKRSSICGQYLSKHPITDKELQSLLKEYKIKPCGYSKYNKKERFASGTMVPRNDFFLMAFARLDKAGLGKLTYEEYLECLERLWKEIDLYHGTDDVYLPVLGSNITRIDKDLTQQELLDIMIASYRLSPYKLKNPFVLHIICKKRDGFTINDVYGIN